MGEGVNPEGQVESQTNVQKMPAQSKGKQSLELVEERNTYSKGLLICSTMEEKLNHSEEKENYHSRILDKVNEVLQAS